MTDLGLKYDLNLPEDVATILSSDCWILTHLNRTLLAGVSDPVKFSSSVSVFIRRGWCYVDINLIQHKVEAPAMVNIHRDHIIQVKHVSDDFDAAFVVMSKRFTENLFLMLKDCRYYAPATRFEVVSVDPDLVDDFNRQYELMKSISDDVRNPYNYQALVLSMSSFFYATGSKCYRKLTEEFPIANNRIPDRFISLVQQHFKEERFLDFYAKKLEITSKHLSRTMKALTGCSAVEWIERYVILEAKVLLKSTNLSIQQISDELNFPSQSFFGKYFKKKMGMSPKEFRNS
jgi:AraC-like DNA-binding protein